MTTVARDTHTAPAGPPAASTRATPHADPDAPARDGVAAARPAPATPSAGGAGAAAHSAPAGGAAAARTRRPSLRRRARGAVLRLGSTALARLPEAPLVALTEAGGELWYRATPARAAQGRLNLQRVCSWLVAHDMASERVRAAASDPAALERLLRLAFRHAARYYLEVARASTVDERVLTERLIVETPDVVERAMSGSAAIVVGLHFGAIELPAAYFAWRTGLAVTIPMETIDDPGLQAWFERTRGATGVRIIGLGGARRELLAALRRGEPVGLVGDRDLTGGGIEVPLFGAPASLPAGPGLLALESGSPVYVAAVRRLGRGRYAGAMQPVPVPTGATRRERLTAFLALEAHAFEAAIARAPEQWWALFFPIWPDLVASGRPRWRTRRGPGTPPADEAPAAGAAPSAGMASSAEAASSAAESPSAAELPSAEAASSAAEPPSVADARPSA